MAKSDGTNGAKIGRHGRNPSSRNQAARSIRNIRRRADKHDKMLAYHGSVGKADKLVAVPRGTARDLRRRPLQAAYAEKHGLIAAWSE